METVEIKRELSELEKGDRISRIEVRDNKKSAYRNSLVVSIDTPSDAPVSNIEIIGTEDYSIKIPRGSGGPGNVRLYDDEGAWDVESVEV